MHDMFSLHVSICRYIYKGREGVFSLAGDPLSQSLESSKPTMQGTKQLGKGLGEGVCWTMFEFSLH